MRCLYGTDHPCGSCYACLLNRQRAFCFRLDQEKDEATFYYWMTLQYDPEHVPYSHVGDMCFSKDHCRSFFEKIRKRYTKRFMKQNYGLDLQLKFKHFLVSEYGPNGTRRPHYHLLYMVYMSDITLKQKVKIRHDILRFILDEAWPYGHVEYTQFHSNVLSYLTKYCCKPELIGEFHSMKPFTLISPGIGLKWLEKQDPLRLWQMILNKDFTVRYGTGKLELPRYYKDRIMPHSLADMRKAVESGDMNEYRRIMMNRSESFRRQLQLQEQQRLFEKDPEDLIQHREQVMAEFRSKLKNRKNI